MPMGHNASQKDYDRALEGVDFPASRDAILGAARDKGGIDAEVPFVLGKLPAQGSYESRAELDAAIAGVYAREGGLEGAGPAAPAAGRTPDPAADAPTAPAPDDDATKMSRA